MLTQLAWGALWAASLIAMPYAVGVNLLDHATEWSKRRWPVRQP